MRPAREPSEHEDPNAIRPRPLPRPGERRGVLPALPRLPRLPGRVVEEGRLALIPARIVGLLVVSLLIVGTVGVAATVGARRAAQKIHDYVNVSIPRAAPLAQTTFVYDRGGNLLTALDDGINRIPVPFSQISPWIRVAAIAIEDRGFYHHGGVSTEAIVRAALENATHHQILQGGSTIAQQYVKNVYTNGQRTLGRKIREALIAMQLEHRYSKDQILQDYLNTVYFGEGAYGVEAAAETYWGIHASQLDPVRAATLAALIQAPVFYDPVHHPMRARDRRNLVLEEMAKQGYLPWTFAVRVMHRPVKVHLHPPGPALFPYWTQYVSQSLQRQLGPTQVFTGGLRVSTTLDPTLQQIAERAVASWLPDPNGPQGALVAIDPSTGAIRAMVGGRDFTTSKFNLATQAHRQAGSSFKPFTLVTALEQGISLNSILVGPPQITIPDKRCLNGINTPWQPHNYADEAAGTMPLIDALANSVNTIFAQVVTKVGPENVAATAHRMGIESPLRPVCSITLGTQPVTPLEMADAYATLAARGVHHAPIAVSRVVGPDGRVVWQPRVSGTQAIPQNVADLAVEAMEGVITHGTGTAADIGRPAAGKTGTAEGFVDAWFCGFVPQLATCVWVGYPKGEIPLHNLDGFGDVVGGSVPARIWHEFMAAATANMSVLGFANPPIPGAATFIPPPGGFPGFGLPGFGSGVPGPAPFPTLPPLPPGPPAGGGGGGHHHKHP